MTINQRPWRLPAMEQLDLWLRGVGYEGHTAMLVFNQNKPALLEVTPDGAGVLSLAIDKGYVERWERKNNRHWGKAKAKPYVVAGMPCSEDDPTSVASWLTARGADAQDGTFIKMGLAHMDEHKHYWMGNAGFQKFRLAWFEIDTGTYLQQRRQIKKALGAVGIRPWLVSSGGKSVHGFIPLTGEHSFEEVSELVQMLTFLVGGDPTVATQHRQMRVPGFPRPAKNREQVLLQIGDDARPLKEVRKALCGAWKQRGIVYSPKRFDSWVVAKLYIKNRKALPSSTDGTAEWFLRESSPEMSFGGWLRGAYKNTDGEEGGKPSPYRDDATAKGRKVKALEQELMLQHGLPGVFQMFEKELITDENNFDGFHFQELGDGVWAGHNPFSETNSSGTSFRVFDGGGWFDWNGRTGGKLADFVIWTVPSIDNCADPNQGEVDLLIAYLQRFAGLTDEEVEEAARKIQGEPDIEKIIEEVAKIEKEPDPAAVPIKIERFKAAHGVSYGTALSAYRARQEALYSDQSTVGLGALLKEPQKAENWLVPGRMQAGSVTSLIGMYGLGKTTAVEGLMLRLVHGEEVEPGYPLPKPLRILYLQSELSKEQHQLLLQEAGWSDRYEELVLTERITVRYGWTWSDKGFVTRTLENAIENDRPYDLIVIDSVSGALGSMPVDENSLQFSQTTYGATNDWKNRYGVSSLVIAHPNAEGKRHRGHSSSPGAVDHVWWLEAVEPESFAKAKQNLDLGLLDGVALAEDFLQIRVEKHRGGFHTGPMLVKLNHSERTVRNYGAMYASGAKPVSKSSLEAFITSRDNGDAYSTSYLRAVGNYGDRTAAGRALRKMRDDGVVMEVKNPQNARTTYYRSVRWGEAPVGQFHGGDDVPASIAKPKGKGKAAAARKPTAKDKPVQPQQEVARKVVDPADLLEWAAGDPLELKHPMAVLEDGQWMNGYVLWKQEGGQLELGYQKVQGQWFGKKFPEDPELVRPVVKKRDISGG